MVASSRSYFVRYIALLITSFATFFCATCLYLSFRKVMDLGGFVARGGPYEIAHPMPDWMVWVAPTATFLFIIFGIISQILAVQTGGVNFFRSGWVVIFLSGGLMDLEYGIFKYHRIIWSWLISGIIFTVMGAGPLFLSGWRKSIIFKPKGPAPALLLTIQLAIIGLAIYLGVVFIRGVAR